MQTEPNRVLAREVADRLRCEDACHPNFFVVLSEELEKNGYRLEAHQMGIQGTNIRIVQT